MIGYTSKQALPGKKLHKGNPLNLDFSNQELHTFWENKNLFLLLFFQILDIFLIKHEKKMYLRFVFNIQIFKKSFFTMYSSSKETI